MPAGGAQRNDAPAGAGQGLERSESIASASAPLRGATAGSLRAAALPHSTPRMRLAEASAEAGGLADRRVTLTPRTHDKLGPCRASAAGWLHSDPIGQSGLRSRIKNRRFLKERKPLRAFPRWKTAWRKIGTSGRPCRLPPWAHHSCLHLRNSPREFLKNTHRRPSRQNDPPVWTAAGFCADVGLIGWAQR